MVRRLSYWCGRSVFETADDDTTTATILLVTGTSDDRINLGCGNKPIGRIHVLGKPDQRDNLRDHA
jgi:hypothetical protein